MLTEFKSIAASKHGYVCNFTVEESRGDAIIKSKISVNIEDAEIDLEQPLDVVIKAAQIVAVREYGGQR
jgi:hypothetical protein